ncbi:MAG: hypothetical protein JJV98_01695 [Desulfosarcina sp.]|nr:hypothetical protein [Desulfobacterales bacterium]
MKTNSNEKIVDTFLDHIRYFKIVHHVPGRIRVKAGWDGVRHLVGMDNKKIEDVIDRIPGITSYRINKKALTVIATYDSAILSFTLWEEVGSLGQYPMKREEVREKLLTLLDQKK